MFNIKMTPDIKKVNKEIEVSLNKKNKNTNDVIKKYTEKIKEDAILNAPRDTGNLKQNIKSKKIKDGFEVYVDKKAYYGYFIHQGHWTNGVFGSKKKIPPNKFLYNAFTKHYNNIIKEIKKK